MHLTQLSCAENAGGAERVATDLHDAFRLAGHHTTLLTPRPDPDSRRPGVVALDLDHARPRLERLLQRLDRRLARPLAALRRRRGYDDPHHPWTAHLADRLPQPTDVLQLHNLHGHWFDLRQLTPLSQRFPVVLTLHDAWLPRSGPQWPMHTATWSPRALRANRDLRDHALQNARLRIVTPSRWLADVWDASPWAPRLGQATVIPNGIDLTVFHPSDAHDPPNAALRRAPDERVVLSVGLTGRGQPSHTQPDALLRLAAQLADAPYPVTFVCVGPPLDASQRDIRFGNARLLQPGRITDRAQLAALYRAADVLLHAVHEDNFPSVVLEALACGTPVVAPRVGGIPEQFTHGAHGQLHDPQPDAQRAALRTNLDHLDHARAMGHAAADHARARYDRQRMAQDYVQDYAQHYARLDATTSSP